MSGDQKEVPRITEIIAEVGSDPIATARYKDAVRVSSGLPPVVSNLPQATDDWLELREKEQRRFASEVDGIEEGH